MLHANITVMHLYANISSGININSTFYESGCMEHFIKYNV